LYLREGGRMGEEEKREKGTKRDCNPYGIKAMMEWGLN